MKDFLLTIFNSVTVNLEIILASNTPRIDPEKAKCIKVVYCFWLKDTPRQNVLESIREGKYLFQA